MRAQRKAGVGREQPTTIFARVRESTTQFLLAEISSHYYPSGETRQYTQTHRDTLADLCAGCRWSTPGSTSLAPMVVGRSTCMPATRNKACAAGTLPDSNKRSPSPVSCSIQPGTYNKNTNKSSNVSGTYSGTTKCRNQAADALITGSSRRPAIPIILCNVLLFSLRSRHQTPHNIPTSQRVAS